MSVQESYSRALEQGTLQVSYIIVDDADTEMEVIDPFAEAGIEVPPELPYKSDKQGQISVMKIWFQF